MLKINQSNKVKKAESKCVKNWRINYVNDYEVTISKENSCCEGKNNLADENDNRKEKKNPNSSHCL